MQNKKINPDLVEWIESLENILLSDGKDHAKDVLEGVIEEAKKQRH